jgi:predicted AlkP superfamily pyrophosphatase or phosphodiesterase
VSKPVVVIDIVGLTPGLVGADTPHLAALARDGFMAPMSPVLPAVTCTAQATMLTGTLPREHGIVANGWYFRDLAEVWFWRQSNHLVGGEKVWETARRAKPGFRCAKIFWWYNMYSTADLSITPRPIYPADGRKVPGLYSAPVSLEQELVGEVGEFPFFNFWGPTADLRSTDWIARAAARVFEKHRPDLTLVYLPHLDYNFQRLGASDPRVRQDVREVDAAAGKLIEAARAGGAEVVVVSEYGLENATGVIHVNRALRNAGLLSVRETLGWEMLDMGASRAFAVSDHQVAHVYVRDPADLARVRSLIAALPGVDRVLDEAGKREVGLDHARSGELVAVAAPGYWFTYYYWLDDRRAPDFANTVDIHRKPGYDPAELFLDPDRPLVKGRIAWNLLRKKLGFRYLMDVIPLKAEVVKGTHGRLTTKPDDGPVLIASSRRGAVDRLAMTGVRDFLLREMGV